MSVRQIRHRCGVLAAAVVLAALVGVPAASAEALSPWWGVTSGSQPTNLVTGEMGRIVVTAENRGDASTSGEVTIVDQLPAGLDASAIKGVAREGGGSGNRGPVSCVLATLTCTFSGSLHSFEEIEVDISVSVQGAASGEQNIATVSGGGAATPVSASHQIEVDGGERFGVEDFQLIPESPGGSVDTQAGSHPFQLTSVVTLNTTTPEPDGGPRTVALPKDIVSELPAGLIANPGPLAQCTEAQFAHSSEAEGHIVNACPASSAVGVATMTFNEPAIMGVDTVTTPIFNMEPLPGEPARFGVRALGLLSAFLETAIRSGGDYGVTLASSNVTEEAWLLGMKLTLWGVPGDPRHDSQRGWECLEGFGTCSASTWSAPPPFLAMPTSCQAPFRAALRGDSWNSPEHPAERFEGVTYTLPEKLDGCNHLPFTPEVTVTPEGAAASTPAAFSVDVHVPQSTALDSEDLVESSVRDITIVLPAGVALNPSGADGLQACSESQVGFTGFGELDSVYEPGVQTALFTPTLSQPFCPDAAKIGTVKLKTPLLANPLEGEVYLAAQNANPFGSLVAAYIVAEEPASGVLVKLPGKLTLDSVTGRLTATFQNAPQLPFEDIDLEFFGGQRAPLATPARCGAYTSTASFTPWSGEPGEAPRSASSTFNVTSGPSGSPCPGQSLPFSPSLTGGSTNMNAGSFSALTATISRDDGQQSIQSVQLKLPPGLSGILAAVKPCPEAQANAGTCAPESLVGETTLSAGLGGDPFTITGGRVYLTEGYGGAPFGFSIVSPALLGPFDLQEGRPIVIRARLEIDPATAALTITTAAGVGGIPNIIDGFPLQIKHLNITVGRQGFTLNPTSCNPMSVTGTIAGDEGASVAVSSPFQLANCASLKFTPKLTALTRANGEFAGHGAGLHVVIVSPAGQANMRSLKVDLPQRLPARLETIQHACPERIFNVSPATCPKASLVGQAIVQTPMLSTSMTGLAILVSHGAAFPNLVLVLKAQGVTIDLTGAVYVDARNVTSVTFRAIPDVPIRRLDLILPEGSRSIFAASASLCTKKPLTMLTAINGQNGVRVKRTVKVAVEGCKKPKRKRRVAAQRRRPAARRKG
jgi:hypothetical protein